MAVALPVAAQSWLDYDQVLMRYPLLNTGNSAALTTYAPDDSLLTLLGEARLTMGLTSGRLQPLNASPQAWDAGAGVRSIYRMNRRVVVQGSMDYGYRWGNKAGGSVWIDADRMPFDITETADSTRGVMSLENYHLHGGLGVDVGGGVSLGTRVDYTTASGAKKKDPRHTTSLMDLEAGVGATWHTDRWTLGTDYRFGRSTEALKFSTVGRTDQLYHFLIDFGALYGREESTDGNGYVGSSHERPLLDIRHGAAVQANYHNGLWQWGLEGGWTHRHGHYGIESPSMIDFNRHNGDQWDFSSWWQRDGGDCLQRVTATWHHQVVKDYERTYRIVTEQGVTDVVYYDDRLMGNTCRDQVGVTALAQWGMNRHAATWSLQAAFFHNRREVTSSIYPFYRQQEAHSTGLTLEGTRNWLNRNDGLFMVQLNAGWAGGGGAVCRDGEYETATAGTANLVDNPLYLMRQYELLTARRLLLGTDVRYSMPVARHSMRLYSEVSYRYSQAFDVHYLENGYRHALSLSLGCLF